MIPRQTLTWWTQVGRERRGVGEGMERLKGALTSKRAQKDQNPHRRPTHWTCVSWAAREIRKREVKASARMSVCCICISSWFMHELLCNLCGSLQSGCVSMQTACQFFHISGFALALSLFMSCHSQSQDPILSAMTGGRPASMQPTSFWIYCRVLLYCLEQKQFNGGKSVARSRSNNASFTEPLHFHYGTPLTHFRSCLGCLHEVYEVNYLGEPGDRKDQCWIALVAPGPIGSLMFRHLGFDLR